MSQTYESVETILIDDGSTDDTLEIATAYRSVRVIRQENQGVAAARNRGIQAALGSYILPLDADDILEPTAVQELLRKLLEAGDEVALSYGWSRVINEFSEFTGRQHVSLLDGLVETVLLCHNFLGNASCSLIRKDYLLSAGGYDEEFQKAGAQGCEDWDLYLRLAQHYKFVVVPQYLIRYRRTPVNMSTNTLQMKRSFLAMLAKHKRRKPGRLSVLYRVSETGFNLYLAQLCVSIGNRPMARFWCRESLNSSAGLSICRPEFWLSILGLPFEPTSSASGRLLKQRLESILKLFATSVAGTTRQRS